MDTAGAPPPEELKPQSADSAATANQAAAAAAPVQNPRRRGTYKPSHRATFLGLAVVVLILAINGAVIGFVIKSQSKKQDQASQAQVSINQDALSRLGVNRTIVGESGIELTVNPDAKFNGRLQVGGDVSVAGQLKLNSKFSAADASLTQLEAGKTSLSQLNVNGDGTLSNLNLRNDLIVAGTTRLQAATFSKLVTVDNNLNVAGNLSVGGTLAVGNFSSANLTIAGHLISSGGRTTVSRGSAVGSGGTVSISGNDSSGTVNVNMGSGPSSGMLASISFNRAYSSTPNVVITPIGRSVNYYIQRSTSGFSIWADSPSGAPATYAFSYIVEQ